MVGIKVGIDPVGREQRVTVCVRVTRVGNVDRAADLSLAAVVLDRATVRADHAVDTLYCLAAGVESALDDLHPVEVGIIGIAQHTSHERGCLAVGSFRQIAAHRRAVGVVFTGEVQALDFIDNEIPTAEDAHADARAGGRVGFPALDVIPVEFPRVFAGPQAPREQQCLERL